MNWCWGVIHAGAAMLKYGGARSLKLAQHQTIKRSIWLRVLPHA
jgi:hypothetical protein